MSAGAIHPPARDLPSASPALPHDLPGQPASGGSAAGGESPVAVVTGSAAPGVGVTARVWSCSFYPGLILAWVAIIIYGSLLPFDLRLPENLVTWQDTLAWLPTFLSEPRWHAYLAPWRILTGSSVELWSDIGLNLILYLPLGMFLRLHDRRRGRVGWSWMLRAFLCILALSWLLECVQSLSPMRWANLIDVVYNSLGGAVGLGMAPLVADGLEVMLFKLYCHCSFRLQQWRALLQRERALPGVVFCLMSIMGLLVFWWSGYATGSGEGQGDPATRWIPFYSVFLRPYAQAVEDILRTMTVYAALALLLALQFLSLRHRRGLGMVVVLVVLLAVAMQSWRHLHMGRPFDLTEPLLALLAVAGVGLAALASQRAIRSRDRRRQSIPVRVDRRRYPAAVNTAT